MQFLELLQAEVRRQLILIVRYPLEMVASIAILVLLFYGFVQGANLFIGDGKGIDPSLLRLSLLGYLSWTFAMGGAAFVATDIQTESEIGLIETTFCTAFEIETLYLARIGATIVIGLLSTLPVAGALIWLLDVDLNLQWSAILPGIALIVAACGVGFAYGGLALVFKRVQLLLMPIQFGALGLFAIPTNLIRDGLNWFSLIPGLPAVDAMRRMSSGEADLALGMPMALATANAALFLILGLLAFRYCLHRARRGGLVGQY